MKKTYKHISATLIVLILLLILNPLFIYSKEITNNTGINSLKENDSIERQEEPSLIPSPRARLLNLSKPTIINISSNTARIEGTYTKQPVTNTTKNRIVHYRKIGTHVWQQNNTLDYYDGRYTKTITGLEPDTDYEVFVELYNHDLGRGETSPIATFRTKKV